MSKKIKQPELNKGKHFSPHYVESDNADLHPPYFSLRYLTKSHCISNCTDNEKVGFVDKIFRLSQINWLEIKKSQRHGLGFEVIDRKCIRQPIPSSIPEDATIIAFRFHEFKPMVGYRRNVTFFIIWFDRDYSLYDHT